MFINCPNCQTLIDVPETSYPRHNERCSACGKPFLAAAGLTFRYGSGIPGFSKAQKVACPYCGQHYDLSAVKPHNRMIGCMSCAGVFALPEAENPSERRQVASSASSVETKRLPRVKKTEENLPSPAKKGRDGRPAAGSGHSRPISLAPRPPKPLSLSSIADNK